MGHHYNILSVAWRRMEWDHVPVHALCEKLLGSLLHCTHHLWKHHHAQSFPGYSARKLWQSQKLWPEEKGFRGIQGIDARVKIRKTIFNNWCMWCCVGRSFLSRDRRSSQVKKASTIIKQHFPNGQISGSQETQHVLKFKQISKNSQYAW